MPGRTSPIQTAADLTSAGTKPYRYGFGGQESDFEINNKGGTSYTAEYWEYDPRLGKRWNIDPVFKPWESSYACFNGNPIFYSDPTGEDPPEKLSNGQKFKNWLTGKSYKNQANDFAVENQIDEVFINDNKKGTRVEISTFQTKKAGVNEAGESIYEIQENVYFFNEGGSIGRAANGSQGDSPFMDILYQPEKEYGNAPDVGFGPVISMKSIKDLAKIARLGSASLKMTLPAWRKVGIDVEHIMSGHTVGGSRVSNLKSLFPETFDAAQVEKTVRSAYKNVHTKLVTQGDRILVQGTAENGMNLEMWLNKSTKTIETAYPIK